MNITLYTQNCAATNNNNIAQEIKTMLVSIKGMQATPTNKSGTITTGGVAQTVAAANPARKGFWFQNVSDTEMWISELGTATTTQPCIKVAAGALYEFNIVPVTAISVICTTTGKAFSAREY